MKSKGIAKMLAILMSVQMVLSMVPASVFAADDPVVPADPGQQTESIVTEQSVEDEGTVTDEGTAVEAGASESTEGEEQDLQPAEEETEQEDIKDENAGDDATVKAEETPETETSGKVEVHGVSKTNNIVGDVFVNMLNAANDPQLDALRQASLEKYPLESHELSYYDGSLRVRYLEGGDNEGPNYLVYRDSYLIISEEESSDYEIKYSEDGLTAYVTPPVPAEELEGKTGLVLLGENVGYDDIMVFDGAPEFEDGFMSVPIKATEEITANELFSDGKLVPNNEQTKKRGLLKSGIGPVHWETSPEGTNWKADINSFSTDWPKPGFEFDVWELLFEVRLSLHFELGFEIETTGSSGGLEERRIAGFNVPVQIFDLAMNYNLQVNFSDEPIDVKGTIITDFDYGFGTHGGTINNYRTKVNISELTVKNPADYNKDIDFYIGSQLTSEASVIKIDIDIWITEITIGPVFKLSLDCRGGCYFTARHEKDLFSPPPDKTKNEIHTCTQEGKDGCLSLKSVEKYRTNIWFKIDLYFDDWTFDLTDPSETTVETKNYYNSYTFKSGMKEGFCPHHFYRVPVRVWMDEEKTIPAPEGIAVTVSDTLDVHESEKDLIATETNDNGEAILFLPYKDEYCYTCVATGMIDGKAVAGSKRTIYIQKTPNTNPTVHIILRSDEKVTVKADVGWNVDSDKKDVPSTSHALRLVLYKRAAGTDDEWQVADDADDFGSAVHWTDKAHSWEVKDWTVPKFGFKKGTAFLYEYRVRILEDVSSNRYEVITPENDNCYINRHVDAYDNAAGVTEQSHTSKYHIDYDDEITDDVTTTTITGTAVMDVSIRKLWKLTDPENKTESVYLALQQKPETGWESKADAARVPVTWVPVMNPFSGDSTTLKELRDAELLNTADYTGEVENTPLTLGEVNDDNEWKLTYRVPKYRRGVQMQFEGSELDSSVITRLLKYEYDLETRATVPSFGNFASIPGLALNDDSYTKSANVINMDPLPDNTIRGTGRWEAYGSWWNAVPAEVRLNVYKNGEELDESPITLKKSDYNGEDTWIWTLTMDPEEYDPDAEYTVKETFPDGSKEWVGVTTGLDVYNYRIWYDYVQCEAQAVFDYEPSMTEIKVSAREKGSAKATWNFTLNKSDGWWNRNADKKKTEVKDISEYEMSAPNIPGYVRVYGEPYAYTRPGWGNLFYNFTVYYIKQSDHLKLHITKEWENTDESTIYPKEVNVTVYRDGEKIAEETLKKKVLTQKWDEVVVTEDLDGNDLKRLDDSGRKYVYTVVETPVDGFTSTVSKPQDEGDDLYYTISNTWVGPENVNVKGTVKWEGDEDKEYLRPETVSLSVINSKEEYVKTIKVPTDGTGKWEAKYLPAKDKDGEPLTYSVLESHVKGYTSKYAEPVYDEKTRTYTCDVTNKLTGYFPLKIKKKIEGDQPEKKETYKFDIQVKEGSEVNVPDRENPLPVNNDKLTIEGEGEVTAEFLLDEEGLYLYSAKEIKGEDEKCDYDQSEKLILISKSYDEETGEPKFKSWVSEAEKQENDNLEDGEVSTGSSEDNSDVDESATDGKDLPDKESDTVEFVNKYPDLMTIEKKWDIDLKGSDRPDSIEVVVQEKKGDKWEDATVKVKKGDDWEEATEIELSKDNDWKVQVDLGKEDKKDDKDSGGKGKSEGDDDKKPEYRVRELTEKNAISEFSDKVKAYITDNVDSSYDDVIGYIKGYGDGKYFDALPKSIQDAANEGAESLKKELDATTENLYDKLIDKMGIAQDRIVYDDDDDDKGDADANQVRYHADGHITKYQVKYEEDDGNWTITNKAILDVDVIKRWVGVGVDDDDMPDAAWVVLLFKPDPDALAEAEKIPGVDLSSLLKYEFPEFTPFLLEGGNDPVAIISKLALGIDLDIFGKFLPKFAIARVTEEDDWTASFVVSKYAFGVPLEFKGAELGSEIIRQIVKYLTGIDSYVSYNPFDNYFSIPTKAIQTVAGITQLSDITDLSNLAGKFWEKAKSLTWDDIKNFNSDVLFDHWHLMGNAINVKIDWDIDNPDTIEGKKIWKDDKEDTRPDYLVIHVKDGDEEIEGSPIRLEKSEFEGKDTWAWSIDLKDDSDDEDGDDEEKEESKIDIENLVVTEEYPDNFEYKDNYTCTTDDLDITNTWHDVEPETVTIQGKKIWKDDNDRDKLRPEKITVRLLADGEEIRSVETSKAGGWKYQFDKLPKYKENKEEENGDDNSGDSGNTGGENAGSGTDSGTGESSNTGEDTKTEIKYEIAEVEVKGYETKVDGYNLINKHESESVTVEGKKVWNDYEDQEGKRPDSITIRLKANGEEVKSTEVSEDDDWAWKFENLPKSSKGKDIIYTISEDTVKDYTTEITKEEPDTEGTDDGDENTEDEKDSVISFTVTNTYNPGKTQVSVSKVWKDEDNQDGIRPESVEIILLADGKEIRYDEDEPVSLTLSEDNDWIGIFDKLPTTKDDKQIEYSVKEKEKDAITGEDGDETYGYEIAGDAAKGYTVTNTHTPQTVTIEGEKVWEDEEDQDGKRPQRIMIRLKDGDKEINHEVVTEDEDWSWKFEDLPKNKDGEEIEYTIEEDEVEDYTSKIEKDDEGKYTVTNTHEPETVKISGTKVWDDADDQDGKRPESITIHVMANGKEVEGASFEAKKPESDEAANTWTWESGELPKYEKGKEIKYTIEEEKIEGYTSEIEGNAKDGFTITNTHIPELIRIEVDKVWEDEDDQDGKRPDSVTIHLKDGKGEDAEEKGSATLNDKDDWTWTFDEMPKYADGKEIDYTVTEDEVDGYTAEVKGSAEEGFTVTNIYTPAMIEISGTKVWKDNDDQDGKRPDSVTIRLKVDGKEVRSVDVTEEDEWKWSFTDLPQYLEGNELTYTISEDAVTDYTADISGDAEEGFTVTNTYTPGKTQIDVSKVWDDEDDQDNIRPTSVTVKLVADGIDTGKTLTLSEANSWSGTFTDLDAMKRGKEIKYTVEEKLTDVITGTDGLGTYAVKVTGSAAEGFTVTNTHRPEKITITGEKVWKDDNDKAGKRPESIRIRIKADGTDSKVRTVTAEDGWKWRLGLPKYDGDREIIYTLTEDTVPGYTTVITGDAAKGYTVTNKYDPDKTQVSVTKVWKDSNDQDSIRPDSVAVKLLANGKEVNRDSLTAEGNWQTVFTDLNVENEDGEKIVYTVEEVRDNVITGTDAEGTYAVNVSGDADKGFTITNTHTPTTVRLKISAVWDDADDQDGIRPKDTKIILLADGKPATDDKGDPIEMTLNEDNKWKGVFSGLPQKKDGKDITYTVEEEKTKVITGVDGPETYADAVTGNISRGFVVTNTHTPLKTEVKVSKVWDDKEDMDEIRPGSVDIRLLADGADSGQIITLDAENQWTATFTELNKNKAGKPVKYTVEEELTGVITGKDTRDTYAVEITGDQSEGYTITNKHTPVRYTITYKLNGGTYNGSPEDIKEIYKYGTVISIHEKPVREGYEFLYWKGSEYQPGDKYTVKSDHTFVAQWKKSTKPDPDKPDKPDKPGKGTRTGDETNIGIWLAAALIAAAGLAGLLIWRRRRRDD